MRRKVIEKKTNPNKTTTTKKKNRRKKCKNIKKDAEHMKNIIISDMKNKRGKILADMSTY